MNARPLSTLGCVSAALAMVTSAVVAKTHRVPADHDSIQAAIDASAEGDRILVAPGRYRERITLKAGIYLGSEGDDEMGEAGLRRAEATVIDGSVEGADSPGVAMAERSTLDGFTVTGVGDYDEKRWQRHWDERGENQDHEHIGGFGSPGIGADGVSCRITNCIVHHNGHTGIAIRGSEARPIFPVVEANVCHRNMGGGIGIMGKGASGLVRGNRCYENFYAGIGHSDHAAPLVVENECYENVRAGIGVSEGSCPVVRDNRCHANRRAGIGIRTGGETRPIIEGNHCYQNGMAGIGTEDHAQPVIIGNRCERNAMAGIGARSGAKPTISGNVCQKNAAAGIGIRAGCEAIIVGNTCVENALVAIGVPDDGRAVIVGNTLTRTGGMPPLVAIRGGSEATLVNNRLNGGGVAGVLVEGKAVLRGNTLQGQNEKFGQGIWLWKGSHALESDNEIEGYKQRTAVQEGATLTSSPPVDAP